MQKNTRDTRSGLLFSLVLVGLAAFAWVQRNAIFDAIQLHNYTPPANVVALADQTTMTPGTRHLFYVYHPELEDKTVFNQHCSDSEKTIVLGCYISHRGIYLYNVNDTRLNGVEQVTAAHETLHAAYERLSPSERKHVEELINQAYPSVTDPRIKATIDDYRKNGADVTNELHSILGTEVRNLPAPLEAYYQRYFTNRAAVVKFSEQYESEFTNRENERQEYDAQLSSLKKQIDELSAGLTARERKINSDYQTLIRLKQSGKTEEYNAGVPGYNAEVNSYNADVNRVQAMIQQYNDIVKKRNALVIEESELTQAIDSRQSTIDQQ